MKPLIPSVPVLIAASIIYYRSHGSALWLACTHILTLHAIQTGLVPETPRAGWELSMSRRINLNREKGKRYSLVILCEGAVDLDGNRITSQKVKPFWQHNSLWTVESRFCGHIQPGGTPSAFDRVLATLQGVHAVHALISKENPDSFSIVIGVQNNKIVTLPLTESVEKTRNLGIALENRNFMAAYNLRDPDFRSVHDTMVAITTPAVEPALRQSLHHYRGSSHCHYSYGSPCLRYEYGHVCICTLCPFSLA